MSRVSALALPFGLAALLILAVGPRGSAHAAEGPSIDTVSAHTPDDDKEEKPDAAKEAKQEDGEESAAEGTATADEDTAEGEGDGKKDGDKKAEKQDGEAKEKKADAPKKKADPRLKRIAEMEAELKELKAKAALDKARQDAELLAMKLEVERLAAETSLESARRKKATATYGLETSVLAAENALLKQKLDRVKSQTEIAKFAQAARVSETSYSIALAENREKAKSRVLSEVQYKSNPFQGGELCVTDRRIPLNGVITSSTATYVSERIHFFNNQSEAPIFIVIDSSPGGSVMAGYRIMKAMEASDAPVHVVVKSYAASMAAIITTLAEDSYAYPNAIILHHQMSTRIVGNMTEQAEQLEVAQEWARRIMDPLSEKLGTTPEQFVKDMYANNSTGDWEEFADRAKELKWVGNIVPRIREEAVMKMPSGSRGASGMLGSVLAPVSFDGNEEVDDRGVRFKRLPRLQPYDFYFVHNPDGYYRY